MAVEGRTHKPVVDFEQCGYCAVCLEACPAEIIPEMRKEAESMRGKIYAGQDLQVRLKEDEENPLPRCQSVCPLLQDIRGYIRLIAQGQHQQALELIRSTNPLPSICGYVCHHPCESSCARGKVDDPLSIKALKRFAADFASNSLAPVKTDQPKHKLVTIVGSGPAGLAAGYELAKMGYQVEMIESYHRPGGLLAWAIPEFRLPRAILQRDIDFIKKTGVKIQTDKKFGRDITLADLEQNGTAAVIIATGTQKGLKLQLENEGDYEGYWECLQFLRSSSDHAKVNLGRQVIVVGGGNAAMDTARSALKLGAFKVNIIYRRNASEMPADKDEIRAAMAEGVEIQYLTMPVRFITKQNRVTGLECARTELKGLDSQGRPKPVRIQGSDFTMPADAVISAVGQKADYEGLSNGFGTKGRKLEVNIDTLATNLPKVFAAGDFAQGPSTVVEAIASGKKAAKAVDRYLKG
jgi:NADPH-dependent glutamate synthase beta subunit-like oxidoreductase